MNIYCLNNIKNYRATSKPGQIYIYNQFKTGSEVITSMGAVTTNGFKEVIGA